MAFSHKNKTKVKKRFGALIFLLAWFTAPPLYAERTAPTSSKPQTAPSSPYKIDLSGKPRQGKASYYGGKFIGRKMADGTPMNPHANIAASRTLPLGTVVQVTNLKNGKSDIVEIRDRGPYIAGRIIDVSPKVAQTLDMEKAGVVPVEVKPLDIPPAEAAAESSQPKNQ